MKTKILNVLLSASIFLAGLHLKKTDIFSLYYNLECVIK